MRATGYWTALDTAWKDKVHTSPDELTSVVLNAPVCDSRNHARSLKRDWESVVYVTIAVESEKGN